MKILLLNQHFYPEIAATSQLATDLAEDLTLKGFFVSVITGMPSYTESESESFKDISKYQEYKNIKIYRVFTTSFNRHTKVGRLCNYLSFYFFAFCRLLFLKKNDVIITMSTPPYLALLGVFLKKLKRTRLVFWLQDVYPDLAVGFGVIHSKSWITKILQAISNYIYHQSDAIIAIGKSMMQHLINKGVSEKKIILIDNWADPKDFDIIPGILNPIRQKFNLENKFVIVYSGNMGVVHDFELVKQAMLRYKENSDFAFLFIGEGKKKLELIAYCQEKEIHNVFFLPYQPREMIRFSMRAGDVALITQEKRTIGLVVPSKFYGSIAAGRPILAVAPIQSELGQMIQKYQCGLCIDNDDSQGFLDAIEKFRKDTKFYQISAQNSQDIFGRYFSRSVATERFADFIKEILK